MKHYNCLQCFDSISAIGDCPHEYCERRLKETSNPRKETRMTRQEAIKKVNDIWGRNNGDKIVRVYEALGFIKFEEESEIEKIICNSRNTEPKNIIGMLELHGYKIVKIGQYMTVTDGRSNFNGTLVDVKDNC